MMVHPQELCLQPSQQHHQHHQYNHQPHYQSVQHQQEEMAAMMSRHVLQQQSSHLKQEPPGGALGGYAASSHPYSIARLLPTAESHKASELKMYDMQYGYNPLSPLGSNAVHHSGLGQDAYYQSSLYHATAPAGATSL